MKIYDKKMIEKGIKVSDSRMYEEDRIWSRYSSDKVDIGKELAKAIRTLSKELPLYKELRALSIGSSAEPQFRILDTAFCGGLYLLDIDKRALSVVNERIKRQATKHVSAIYGDYNKIFLDSGNAEIFLKKRLGGKKVDLITLHHSLYYCEEQKWARIFDNIYRKILAGKGAVHAVLMSSKSNNPSTTTWLYNHFVGKYFGCYNDQDLYEFGNELKEKFILKNAQIMIKTHNILFSVDSFDKFMAVVWMILLYPNVYRYTLKQREEITEYIYKEFWKKKRPLIQAQDHMIVYKGISINGLV